MSSFQLAKAFEDVSEHVFSANLCEVRLMKDGELDWFVLIPRRANIVEWIDLKEEDQMTLTKEMAAGQTLLRDYSDHDKLNIGALGNVTPQFHLHIVARRKNDRAWPGPIWGTSSQLTFEAKKVQFWTGILEKNWHRLRD